MFTQHDDNGESRASAWLIDVPTALNEERTFDEQGRRQTEEDERRLGHAIRSAGSKGYWFRWAQRRV
ncbi:MAG: hypothetical protein V4707_13505 [Pseudomonadota bacterium]